MFSKRRQISGVNHLHTPSICTDRSPLAIDHLNRSITAHADSFYE